VSRFKGLVLFAAFGIGALVFASFDLKFVRAYVVVSASMEPTLHCAHAPGCRALHGDRIVASSLPYFFSAPDRGDVVILELRRAAHACAESLMAKRVVAVPGDTVAQLGGHLYVNGQRVKEKYLPRAAGSGGDFPVDRLKRGQYFVMGDNRAHSCDSREFGPVLRNWIVAEVLGSI
jgi:signal peptidase I